MRTNLSSLLGLRITSITVSADGRYHEFRDRYGACRFKVRIDDLFDSDGYYFEDNIGEPVPVKTTFRVQRRFSPHGSWRFSIAEGEVRKHRRFATRGEAQAYCDGRMAAPGCLVNEEWRVFPTG
jgi:hypothetical protein